MSKRPFFSTVLIFGLILAQVLSNGSGEQNAQDRESGEQKAHDTESGEKKPHDTEPEEPKPHDTESDPDSHLDPEDDQLFEANEKNPSLYCLLFGDSACDIECFLIAQVYKTVAYGFCDEHLTCHCHTYIYSEFQFNWQAKFKARYVYDQIILNRFSFKKIRELVEYPLRTSKEIKQLIKPYISPFQYSLLKTRDYSLAPSFIDANGQVKKDAVRRYIAKKFQVLYNNVAVMFITSTYQTRFRDALKTASAATLYNLTFRVRQLGNKTLHDILREHLEQNNIAEPTVELYEQTELDEILDNCIMNEMIKRNDDLFGVLNELLKKYFGFSTTNSP